MGVMNESIPLRTIEARCPWEVNHLLFVIEIALAAEPVEKLNKLMSEFRVVRFVC